MNSDGRNPKCPVSATHVLPTAGQQHVGGGRPIVFHNVMSLDLARVSFICFWFLSSQWTGGKKHPIWSMGDYALPHLADAGWNTNIYHCGLVRVCSDSVHWQREGKETTYHCPTKIGY